MAIALFDTNILIDYLKGYPLAIAEVEYWNKGIISAITWMEVMAGAKESDRADIAMFLSQFDVIHTDGLIMEFAASISRLVNCGPLTS
ncbi:MAG: PIN domain-containing protein [Pseudomonadota bacterium]